MTSIKIETLNGELVPMVWLTRVTDGGSPIRQVKSWQHLEEILIANGDSSSRVKYDTETLNKLIELWGEVSG